jgi:hypothetical protein
MGLDTTHDCWHGPYTAFHRWRALLMRVAYDRDIMTMQGFGGDSLWSSIPHHPKDTLIVLLNHSDSDGEIKAKWCGPLADRLEELLPGVRSRDDDDHSYEQRTKQFITGLRRAARKKQKVGFH